MDDQTSEYESARLLSRVLSYYYVEDKNQGEIARLLHLSIAKVNRILKYARQQGMVEIKLHAPFQHIFMLEQQLEQTTGVRKAIVVPTLVDNYDSILQNVGKAAANYLVAHLRDGDTVAVGGGQFVSSTVKELNSKITFKVKVVPAIGGLQGRHYTDVNNLAAEMAKKLGGEAFQLHAPGFVFDEEERDILQNTHHVKEVLDMARQAQVAIFGIGSLNDSGGASYLHFNKVSEKELNEIETIYHGIGEILSHVLDANGQQTAAVYDKRVLGITLDELRTIPLRIGVAAGMPKVIPITAGLKGGFFQTIVTDEITAKAILTNYG